MTSLPKRELAEIIAQPLILPKPTQRERMDRFFSALVDIFEMVETDRSTYVQQNWSTEDESVRLTYSLTSFSLAIDFPDTTSLFVVLSSHNGSTHVRVILDGFIPVDYLRQLYAADQKSQSFFTDALALSKLPKFVEQMELMQLAASAGNGPIYAD